MTMSSNDAQLPQRMNMNNDRVLAPITGKCSLTFHCHPGETYLLSHADVTSTNDFTVHFKLDGRLWLSQQITQANTNGTQILKRTIIYEPSQISSPLVDANPAAKNGSYRIRLEISGPPEESFETNTLRDRLVNDRQERSEEFPINIASQTKDWKHLTLITEPRGMLKHFTPANATALLLNQPSYHKSVDQETWLHDQYQAVEAEAEFTAAQLLRFRNMAAECVREANFILIKIRFASSDEAQHVDDALISNNLSLRYMIEGPPGCILSAENVSDYATRTGKVMMFTGALVDYDAHADCVLQLRLLQHIPQSKLSRFDGRRITGGVNLHPCLHDQTQVEARLAHSKLNNDFDVEDARELSTLFSKSQPSTTTPAISARRLFLTGEKPLIDRKFSDGTPITGKKVRERETLPSWNGLDRYQQEAIRQTDQFPLSMIDGPPGTGKTRTIAAFLACRFTSNANEKIMICAPRNVAVRKLIDDTAALMWGDNLQDMANTISPLPFVHVETEGIIDASYLTAKPPKGNYHLQNLRIRLATKNKILPFVNGVRALERDGYIADAKEWRRYKDARDFLTRDIMQNARMIFVTTSSARGTFLRALNFLPSILVIDECGCAKPQDIAIPMMAIGNALTRMILAGDSRQLPPLIFTKLAQKIWATSIFASLAARGHIMTRLNMEYRSHSTLYAPTSEVFYEGTVRSCRNTAPYDLRLQQLMESLPHSILQDGNTAFRLSGYAHFLDVKDGQCVYAPGGSSQNEVEARVVINIVRYFLATVPGLAQKHFILLSGYARQVKLIQGMARNCGLYDLAVKTVDGSQGAEGHIAILSVVRDGGDLGFMQSAPRVNVATSRQKTALYIVGKWTVATSMDRKNEGITNYLGRYLQNARSKWTNYVVRPEVSD